MATLTTTFVTLSRTDRSGQQGKIGAVANVAVSDNSYCTFPSTGSGDPAILSGYVGYSQWLNLRELSSKVPTGATINGITLKLEAKRGSNLIAGRDSSIRIVKAGSQVGADKADTGTNYPTTDTVLSRGGSTDLWSTTWTEAEVNATGFGFDVSVYADDGNDFGEYVSIDYVEVVIDYTPSGPQNWTGSGNAVMTMSGSASGTVTPGPGTYTRTYQLSTWSVVARSGNTFGWTGQSSAQVSDDTRALTSGMQGNNGGGGYSTYLQGVGLTGADLPPSNATINGIKVNVERSTDPSFMTGVRDSVLSLVRASTIESTNKAATGTNWPVTTDAVASYGSTSDLWSASWAVADITNAGFGVALSVANFTGTGVPVAGYGRVDQITVEITFTVPAGGTNWTSGGDAQMALTAQSGSQHNMRIGASAAMAMVASMQVGTTYQAFMVMTAQAGALVQKFGAGDSVMAFTGSASAKVTFAASGGAGLALTAAADGFRSAKVGAAAAMALTASATSPLQGTGSANMALTAQAVGTPFKYGAAGANLALTTNANGVKFQSSPAVANMAVTAVMTGSVVKLANAPAFMALTASAVPSGLVSGAAATMVLTGSASGIVRSAVGGAATMALTTAGDSLRTANGAGAATMALTGSASGGQIIGGSGAAIMAMVAAANGVDYQQEGGTAIMAMVASAGGQLIQRGAGAATMAMFASTDSTRIQFGAGAANMAVTGLSGGVRVAQGAGDALMAFTGASGSRATLVGAGAANMAVTASAFFASQQANAQANMIMSASASGRIVARVGGSAQMRIVTNLDSAFDYLVTGKITFEIDPGDTVRFTI